MISYHRQSILRSIFYGTTNLDELRLSGNSLECLPVSTATVISADDGVPDCAGSVPNSATLGAPGGLVISVLFLNLVAIIAV